MLLPHPYPPPDAAEKAFSGRSSLEASVRIHGVLHARHVALLGRALREEGRASAEGRAGHQGQKSFSVGRH